MTRVKIQPGKHSGTQSIIVNGHEMATATSGYTITSKARGKTTVELDLSIVETEWEGEASIIVSDTVADALTALGWTPPPTEAVDDPR